MFDFVQEKKRWVQIILLLLILPFAFWGVDSYRRSAGGAGAVAVVESEKVSQQDFSEAMQQQQDRMREMLRGAFDPAMMDRPEVKQSVLETLINQKLLLAKAQKVGLAVSDEQLAKIISEIDAFHKDGKFDKQQYETLLRNKNMTPMMFEARVRQELAVRQMAESYALNGYASKAAAENLIRLNEQQRMVSVIEIQPEAFLKQVDVSDTEVKDFYDKNAALFRMPERARVEYVQFSADTLQSDVEVSGDEVKQYYEANQAEYGTAEQRRASHILIAFPPKAGVAEKQAVKDKAEHVLRDLTAAPSKFTQMAKQNSDDPGSASNGGDLGFFGRGMMVKPFEDAVFGLKVGETSGLVESDYGYHIIKLVAIQPAKMASLDSVRADIVRKLKQQKAADKFAEKVADFNNIVYEQSDSLQPAAEMIKAKIQQSTWLNRGQPEQAPWTDKALQAVFSDDVIKNKRNSTPVEIAPNVMLAVRLLEYKPADVRPLSEVAASIRQRLQREKAGELAVKQGQQQLTQLQEGAKVTLSWKSGLTVMRAQPGGLEGDALRQVLRAGVSKLPAYVGAESAKGGYTLVRIDAVKETELIDDVKLARYVQQLQQITGEELFSSFMAESRKHASVRINGFKDESAH